MKAIHALLVTSLIATASLLYGQAKPATPLDQIKTLAGTWVGGTEAQPQIIEFKVIANCTAVAETMFPGSTHEMMNLYHMDGDKLMVTHDCAQGVQPRMRAAAIKDGVVKFEFIDSTNLKSRDEPHMDALELTITPDKLTEKWEYFEKGKITEHAVFELKRKS